MVVISILLTGALLISCSPYKRVPVPVEPPPAFSDHVLKLIWDIPVYRDLYLTEATLRDSVLSGTVDSYQKKPYDKKSDRIDVHISNIAIPDSLPCELTIPLANITKIEAYEYSTGKLIGGLAAGTLAMILIALAVGTVFMAVIIVSMLSALGDMDTSSCPFVYFFNGSQYAFAGEIYAGAIHPKLERDDWLPLAGMQARDGQFLMQMTNELNESQSTNLAELLVVDHPKDTSVLMDRQGVCQTISHPARPRSASSATFPDLLPLLARRDSLKYIGEMTTDTKQGSDTVFLRFDRPRNAKKAKLVIRAKNSLWLDHTVDKACARFGSKYEDWYQDFGALGSKRMNQWVLGQGLPLSVSVLKNGKWRFVDYFPIVGPVAQKDLVMAIDLPETQNGTLDLKLECGALFWEIDYVGIDFSEPQSVQINSAALASAIDNNGIDIRAALTSDDDDYYTMPQTGDQAVLAFTAPASRPDCARSFILHSKGYYRMLKDYSGQPDLAFLRQFSRPGRLGLYSRELLREECQKIARQ